jgi:iron(III) transport system substrate-binding protein
VIGTARRFVLIAVIVSALCLPAPGCGSSEEAARSHVVLYCALDREFAQGVLDEFTRQTGLRVVPRFDTEANKSVSLYEDIVREAGRPRCDVHWNNEILATVRLQRQGLLEPYDSPSAASFPVSCKARDHTWTAFAARARVLVVNTRLVPKSEWPAGLLDLTHERWRGKVAMAKPQFGTSATQAACLFQAWGKAKAQAFYLGLQENQVQIVAGNKQVAEGVGQGQFPLGLTDTDDAIAEVEAGRPVAILYPDRDAGKKSGLGTLFIPNTVAVVRGSPNPDGARRLVDYLLSPEVEEKLALSDSRQIPLNPKVQVKLPPQIETPRTVRAMPVDFDQAAQSWDEVQAFLSREFARP